MNNDSMLNKTFGILTVLKEAGKSKDRHLLYLCKCKCGNEIIVSGRYLRSGKTKSCGCDSKRKKSEYHNLSNTVIYRRWTDMRERCNNPKNINYKSYGAKGVKVCDEWQSSFMAFYNWSIENGFSHDLSIDRIDPFGDYCPENCRWVDSETQSNNKRKSVILELNGERKTLAQWCRLYSVCPNTIRGRLKNGYSLFDALNGNVTRKKPKRDEYLESLERKSISAGLDYSTVWSRIFKYGWSEQEALSVPPGHKRKK